MDDINSRVPRTLPVLHVNNTVMFPYLLMPLVITDEESKLVVDHALAQDKTMAFFLDKEKDTDNDLGIYDIGSSVTILRMLRNQA
jgi:ATP-dependent Lon protease